MNDNGKRLVKAADGVLRAEGFLDCSTDKAVAAVLRTLSELMVEGGWEDGNEWPDPGDLEILADDIEAAS